MKKQFLFLAMCIATILSANAQTSVWDGSHTTWTKGAGTQADPYLIENAAQLAHLAYIVNNGIGAKSERIVGANTYWKLATNIDLKGSENFQWAPIGYYNSDADYYAFGGNFDGNGKTIANLYINTITLERIGLFGFTDGASIENFGIIGNGSITRGYVSPIRTNPAVGGIVGYANNTIISNCYNTENVFSYASYPYPFYSYSYSGGIVGYANNTTISNCYNTGNISASSSFFYYNGFVTVPTATYYSGGIVGYGNSTIINYCYNTGNISVITAADDGYVTAVYSSGIVGYGSSIIINYCYNTGNISAISSYSVSSSFTYYSYAGGIGNGSSTINYCYNAGNVSATTAYNNIYTNRSYSYSGGISGNGSPTINSCYNVGTVFAYSSQNWSWGGISVDFTSVINCYYANTSEGKSSVGTPKTNEFMKTAEFVSLLNSNNFAFKLDVPPFANDGYPTLTKGFDMQLFPATNITQTHAILKCLLRIGEVNVITKQIVFNNQTINLNSTDTLLTHTISGLNPNTEYSYTFRAINSDNDTCKLTGSFTTLPITVTTQSATNVTQTKATLNGEVVFGDATVTTKGFEYKLSTEPNFTSVNVSGSSSNITSNLTGLLPNSAYQFRVFCTSGGENFYGELNNFSTLPVTAITFAATNITRSTATLNGKTSFGDATVIEQGFILNGKTIALSNTNATLTYSATDLPHAAQCSYQTYCTTAGGTVYGEVQNFTTPAFNTDGTGYLIENKEDLILLANLVNGGNSFSGQTFILANDINLPIAPNNILSIGNYQTNRPFSGTFHGNGKRIYNVYIDEPNTPYQGFFGYTKDAYLYEVGLVNITASGRNYTGGMVAYAENTRINDSYVSGGTLFALSYCGGLVGYQTQGTNSIITGCYNTCTVSGNNYVGGLLGYSNQGTVRNSYAAALVTGQSAGVGAIIGGAQDVLSYNCYFNDSITGQPFAIGENNISTRSTSSEGNMSSDDMRMQAFVNTLNQGLVTPVWKSDYKEAINNGFPILIWQSNQASGIVETLRATSLQVYPNPAKDYIFIQSEQPIEKIEIYNQSGICVLKNNNPTKMLDVSDLSNGFYLVRIYVNGIPVNKKIIVRK
ncbi:MAG: T9SS type A sorting domain-containing protein [Candidatus Azobacteroides sp.]|nr:T9SS type A sorting domain-containing protein [Candidatus Azobacteroides sp.]